MDGLSNRLLFSILLVCLFIAAFFLQINSVLNHDVSWLLEVSKRFVAGGKYFYDYFENNPPMILYLYAPSIYLSHWLPFPTITLFRCYIITIAALSLWLCWSLLTSYYAGRNKAQGCVLFFALAMLFLIFPLYEFAQREHLLLLLMMPYLLLVANRTQKRQLSLLPIILAGLLAGLGFSIKPYFVLIFALTETYLLVRLKSFKALLRIEAICIYLIFFIYTIVVYQWHTVYLSIILPFAMRWAYTGVHLPWQLRVTDSFFLFCCFTVGMTLATLKINRTNEIIPKPALNLIHILLLACLSLMAIYWVQQSLYYYHLLPAYYLAILLNIQLLPANYKFITHLKLNHLFYFWLCLTLLFIYSIYLEPFFWNTHEITVAIILSLGFFFIVSVTLIYTISQPLMRAIVYIYAFSVLLILLHAILQTYYLIVVSGLFLILLAGTHMRINDLRETAMVMFCSLVLFYPIKHFYLTYLANQNLPNKLAPLITFLENIQSRQQSFAMFSLGNIPVDYINYNYQSKLGNYWMISALVKQPFLAPELARIATSDFNFISKLIVADIAEKKPDYILVDASQYLSGMLLIESKSLLQLKIKIITFNFIDFFSRQTDFKQIWQNYHYSETILPNPNDNQFPSYKLMVFAKNLSAFRCS